MLPCFAIRSVTPVPDWPRTLPTPSSACYSQRLCKWLDPFGRCPSPCATGIAFLGIRPEARDPCPLSGCRRMRRAVAVVQCFSIHLPLSAPGIRQLHRSYEEIRLLHRRRIVVVPLSDPTAEADLWRSLEIRMIN